MKNNNTFSEMIAPALVLVIICLCATLALAGTHKVTQPLIEQNLIQAANEARAYVLPEGKDYTEFDGKLVEGVDDCYIENNGAGMTVTSYYKGFGGPVTIMTGLDANGAITGVTVTNHSETPGLGTKDMTPEYLEQYKGKTELVGGHINNDDQIDAITGATITANAIYGAVYEALAQFKECGGVK